MEQYYILPITINQVERAATVIRQGFGSIINEYGITQENCSTSAAFVMKEQLMEDIRKGSLLYGIHVDAQLVGVVQLKKVDETTYELDKLTVLTEYRHKGYGKILLQYAKDKVKELGGKRIVLEIIEENHLIRNWYEENGFVHKERKSFSFLPYSFGKMELAFDEE